MGLLKNHLSARKPSARQAQLNEAYLKAIAVTPKPKLRSPLQARFTKYFSHPFDAIEDKGEGWKTLKYPLDDGQIWKGWEAGDRLIGLGFAKTTRYAVVDIDASSPHHSEEGLRAITWALEAIGINETVLIQSSASTGWHLYVGFSCPVPTFGLSCLLHSAMEAAGLTIAQGELELFPNRKSFGSKDITLYNRHRLPLQPGTRSYLLDKEGLPYSSDLRVFLDRLDESAAANDIDVILDGCEAAHQAYRLAKSARKTSGQPSPFTPHSANARQWKKDLETAIAAGWTGHHQSNDLLGQIAEHGRVFEGYDDEETLAEYIVKTAIAAPGFIPYCRHQGEIRPWSARWAKSAMKHRYPYGSRKGGKFKPLGKGGLNNEEKHAECLARVSNTVADFDVSGRDWPTTIHARRKLVSRMANCSERTLIKPEYLPLWHPNHRKSIISDGDRQNAHSASDSALPEAAGSHADTNLGVPVPRGIPEGIVAVGKEGLGSVLPFGGLSAGSFPPKDSPCLLLLENSSCSDQPDQSFPSFQNRTFTESFLHCTSLCRPPTVKSPQTQTGKGIESFLVNQFLLDNSKPSTQPFVPRSWQPGDWVVEIDRPHRLLRLASIDDGEWCRCQDAEARRRGTRGELSHLSELLPAPPVLMPAAIAIELKRLQPTEETPRKSGAPRSGVFKNTTFSTTTQGGNPP